MEPVRYIVCDVYQYKLFIYTYTYKDKNILHHISVDYMDMNINSYWVGESP